MSKAKTRTTTQRSKLPDLFESYLQLFEGKARPIAGIFHPHIQFQLHDQPTLVGLNAVATHFDVIVPRLDGHVGSLIRFVDYVEPEEGALLLRKMNFTTAKGADSQDIIGMYHVKDGLIVRAMEMRGPGIFRARPASPLVPQRLH